MNDSKGHEFRDGDTVSANWAPRNQFALFVSGENIYGSPIVSFGVSGRIYADEAHRWTILRRADGTPPELDTGAHGPFVDAARPLGPCGCVGGKTCSVCVPATNAIVAERDAARSERDTEIEWITRLRTERDDYRRQLEALQAQIIAQGDALSRALTERDAAIEAATRPTKAARIESVLRRLAISKKGLSLETAEQYTDLCLAAGEEIARIKAES